MTEQAPPKRRARHGKGGRSDEFSFAVRALPLHAPLTVEEIAAWACVSTVRVKAAHKSGALPSIVVGGNVHGPRRCSLVSWVLRWWSAAAPSRLADAKSEAPADDPLLRLFDLEAVDLEPVDEPVIVPPPPPPPIPHVGAVARHTIRRPRPVDPP